MMDICDELEAQASTVHGGAYSAMHKARKEIIRLRAAQGWQPISTAPRATPILATDGKVIVVLERGECAGDDWPDAVGFGGHEWEWDFEWRDLTHWMPLPAAPKEPA